MQSRVPLRVGKQREISAASRKSECRAAGVNEGRRDMTDGGMEAQQIAKLERE